MVECSMHTFTFSYIRFITHGTKRNPWKLLKLRLGGNLNTVVTHIPTAFSVFCWLKFESGVEDCAHVFNPIYSTLVYHSPC
ncbi:unnamed protein product [Schistosoma rodhaini]|uniref:Uncharacterized protein n=1 Tax=Schistosoma rodhaini TaxID=6188 RepID=A0AA85G924_9TREM|nr:unnamed protein product [Schistosoma rodhaini]